MMVVQGQMSTCPYSSGVEGIFRPSKMAEVWWARIKLS